MRKCEDCKIILANDVRHCPKCGKSIDDEHIEELAGIESQLKQVSDMIAANSKPSAPANNHVVSKQMLIAGGIAGAFVLIMLVTLIFTLTRSKTANQGIRQTNTASQPYNLGQQYQAQPTAPRPKQNTNEHPLAGDQTVGSGLRTAGEDAIKTNVDSAKTVQDSSAKIDDVIADPRQGIAIVTFSIPAGTSATKATIINAAGAIARATFAANNEVKVMTARCLVTSGNAGTNQIAFVGDATRSSIESLPDNPSQSQLEQVFTAPWWNPQIR